MNRKRIVALVALAFTIFIVCNTANASAFDLDPGGGNGDVYADITVKFQKFRCVTDTDPYSGTGLNRGGEDIWLRATGGVFGTTDRTPELREYMYGIPDGSGMIPPPYDGLEKNLNGWGNYFSINYDDVPLTSAQTLDLFVYDLNWGGGSETLIHCRLIFKAPPTTTSQSYDDIFAGDYSHSDSYISFSRVGGAVYYTTVQTPWGSYPWTLPNGLYIDVSIVYHY